MRLPRTGTGLASGQAFSARRSGTEHRPGTSRSTGGATRLDLEAAPRACPRTPLTRHGPSMSEDDAYEVPGPSPT
jgi:hypothetical protein